MSIQMPLNAIWTRFFTKTVCWQNSVVIFEKSYIPHMTSFLAEMWSVYRPVSHESNKIEFASIGLLQLQIFKFEWPKVNTGRLQDLTLKATISMLFLILFSCLRFPERYGCQLFMHWNHFILTSRAHALHKISTEGQICQLSPIYSFLHLSSKSAFKT